MNEYLRPFVCFDEKTPFYIKLAGITYPDPTYHNTRINSPIAVIEYITDGAGYVVLEDGIHHVSKDTIYLLPQGKTQDYYADESDPFTKIFLNVSGSLCEHLISAYGLSGKHFFDGSGLKPIFERVAAAVRSDMPESELQSSLQGIFVEIISRLSVALTETGYSEEALKLKTFLDSNLDCFVSSKELAKTIFRSPDYCQKLFSREFGITPYAYQIEQKMQKARSLLSDTNLPIGEIAETLGYSDLHYFSNLFLRKCGCRPSSYRKRR